MTGTPREAGRPSRGRPKAGIPTYRTDGTDWVYHANFDWRPPSAGGKGFLEVYKGEDDGPWVKVLDIRAKEQTTRGGMTFARGIGYNSDYFWISGIGLYGHKNRFWHRPNNATVNVANVRVYRGEATLEEISEIMFNGVRQE